VLQVWLVYFKARRTKIGEYKMKNEFLGSFNVAIVLNVKAPEKWHEIEQFLNENSKLILSNLRVLAY
jgi:hypothetical protein